MHRFLFKFALVLNDVPLFWKLFVFEFLLGMSETLHCSMPVPHVNIVPLLDARQLLMSVGTLPYSEPRTSTILCYMILLL
jgi:hypothetical protein